MSAAGSDNRHMTKNPLTLDRAIDQYVGELARRTRSSETRRTYQRILFAFCDAYRHKAVAAITTDDCRAFLDRWVNAAPGTIAHHVSILNGFFGFLYDNDHIEQNPMRRIRRPRRPAPEDTDVVTVTAEDIGRMYQACETVQEMLCLVVLVYLGPRRNAAAKLRWRDVDLARGTIRFKEKGGKIIYKPLPAELAEVLTQVVISETVDTTPEAYVIPNRRRARNPERSNKVIYDTVKKIANRAGVDSNVHALRAAFAVHYLETHPGDTEALQKLMGHARMETTQVYLRKQDKFKAMQRVVDLSWFPHFAVMPPTGFEPVISESGSTKPDSGKPQGSLPSPLLRKLEELKAGGNQRSRKG